MVLLLILSTLFLTATFSILLYSNPINIGWIVLIATTTLTSMCALYIRSWYAFLIFLIYMGAVLVIFAYFLAITPNQKIQSLFPFILALPLSFFVAYRLFNPRAPRIETFLFSSLYSPSYLYILLIMIFILLITLLLVVKISSIFKGPLRPFNYE